MHSEVKNILPAMLSPSPPWFDVALVAVAVVALFALVALVAYLHTALFGAFGVTKRWRGLLVNNPR